MAESNTLTVNIRLNSTVKFTLPSTRCTPQTTLGEIKRMIHEIHADIPPERQRVIYRGRVLRDEGETLEQLGFENNQTLHLVKGSVQASSSAPASAPAVNMGNVNAGSSSSVPAPAPATMNFGNMPMPDMSSMGMPNMSPEQMRATMNNPLFQNMMDQMMQNPDMLNAMMQMNPAMQQMMENNPELRHAMSDPSVMRQAMQAMRNPDYMQQMMRHQDLAMSQIENLPGGFNHLRRMYEEVQEPMMDAMASNNNSSTSAAGTSSSTPTGSGPTSEAMPNPWGAAPSPAPTSATSGLPTSSNVNNTSMPTNNSLANAFGNLNMQQPPNINLDQSIQMLENPAIRSMMESVLSSNPDMLQNMMSSNPMLQQMMRDNPAAASMMSNPEMMRNFLNPDNLRAIQQMQQSMQQLQGSLGGNNPWGNMGATNSAPASNGLDFSSLLNTGNAGNTSIPNVSTNPSPSVQQPASVRFASQIRAMEDMGFTDKDANARALEASNGNINRAVDWLLSRT